MPNKRQGNSLTHALGKPVGICPKVCVISWGPPKMDFGFLLGFRLNPPQQRAPPKMPYLRSGLWTHKNGCFPLAFPSHQPERGVSSLKAHIAQSGQAPAPQALRPPSAPKVQSKRLMWRLSELVPFAGVGLKLSQRFVAGKTAFNWLDSLWTSEKREKQKKRLDPPTI